MAENVNMGKLDSTLVSCTTSVVNTLHEAKQEGDETYQPLGIRVNINGGESMQTMAQTFFQRLLTSHVGISHGWRVR